MKSLDERLIESNIPEWIREKVRVIICEWVTDWIEEKKQEPAKSIEETLKQTNNWNEAEIFEET